MNLRRLFFLPLTITVLVSVVSCQNTTQSDAPPTPQSLASEIDEVVNAAMKEVGVVPGFSLAIYTPAGTYVRGFGTTDIETGEEVTADTAFYIASTTKAFTGLAMNILHHRGELNLDMSIADFAPELNLSTALSPDTIKLRDLLTHTHGLDNDLLHFHSAYSGLHSPDTDWHLLKNETVVRKSAPIGAFEYGNIGYNILTTLTDRKLGTLWQDLLEREIFTPVGMTRTSARRSDSVAGNWSVAAPHLIHAWLKDGEVEAGVRRHTVEKNDSNMQSAGGMFMSANDALRWLELLTEEGRIGSNQIIPAKVVRETRAEFVVRGSERGGYTRDFYGLGWNIGAYRDNAIVSHGGDFGGYATHISYMPDLKIGVASFANESAIGSQLPIIINNYIYDRLTGHRNAQKTLKTRITKLSRLAKRGEASDIRERRRRASREWVLTLPFDAYSGTYVNERWGALQITSNNSGLSWSLGELNGAAEPFPQENTIRVEVYPRTGIVAGFKLSDSDEVIGAIVSVDGQSNLFFQRL